MRTSLTAVWAACICAAFYLSAAAGGGGEWESVASKIARFSASAGIDKVSVLSFKASGGAEKSEAEYVSEVVSAYLAGRGKPVVIERAKLEQVIRGAPFDSVTGGLDELFAVDAVVVGTVFAAGERLKAVVKLVDVRTGGVLMAAQGESSRNWPDLAMTPAGNLEEFAASQLDAALKLQPPFPAPPPDLRDALSGSAGSGCESRSARVARLNAELVDEKARYWAYKMREPGFSVSGLKRNPGTEIADPALKARFYRLLGGYYETPDLKPPSGENLSALLELMKEEISVYNECRRF